MAYATKTSVEGVLGRSLTDSEAAALPSLLAAVELYINEACERVFGISEQQSTRYYDVERSTIVDVDAFYTDADKPFEVFYVGIS